MECGRPLGRSLPMRTLALLLALLPGCGPTWPPGWGDPCSSAPPHTSCGPGWTCYLSQTRHGRTGDYAASEACQPHCDGGCPPGWECVGYVCRLPCGPGWGECPPGGACVLGGCEPS